MDQRKALSKAKRIVVKVGTTQITERGKVSPEKIGRLAGALARLAAKRQVVLVTSGAIAAGIAEICLLVKKCLSIPYKQAAAAVGQTRLMQAYAEAFAGHGITVGQVLLTRDAVENRERYLNACNTLDVLLRLGVVPIVNENDTMTVDEIKVGDNDRLAAMVAQLVDADLLVLLSDVDGLYENWGRDGQCLVPLVERVDARVKAMAGAEGSAVSTGGMVTKLLAAEMCLRGGIRMVLADGARPGVLDDIVAGRDVGTLFAAAEVPAVRGRKAWILHHLKKKGTLVVDEGAKRAVLERGTSLLPKGMLEVRGNFDEGDGVALAGPDGRTFAYGIANYGREEAVKIIGRRTAELVTVLGHEAFDEVVHRDNLVLATD